MSPESLLPLRSLVHSGGPPNFLFPKVVFLHSFFWPSGLQSYSLTQEAGGPPRIHQRPGRWETSRTQRTLDEMPDSRKRELTEPPSSRKTGHQVKDGVAIPQSHLWPIIVPVWKNYRDRNGKEPEEKKVQLQAQSGIQLKGRSQGLTLILKLRNAHKKRPVMTSLPKIQQAAERVRCRYLHPTNGEK
jgi:hypothetical protein